MTPAQEAAALILEWRAAHPVEYAAARVRHNRWQAAHGSRLALSEWLIERQVGGRDG